MKYRNLGKWGLKVSEVALGSWVTDLAGTEAEKSRAGHTAEIRKILEAHGADKLSALDKGEYAAVMAEAEVLG